MDDAKVVVKLRFTDDQKKDLKKAFDLLDSDGVGAIKSQDFRIALKTLGFEVSDSQVNELLDKIDPAKSGRLSFEDFQRALAKKIGERDSYDDVMKTFSLFDTANDGKITFETLEEISKILGYGMTEEDIEEMIESASSSGDGTVTKDDFFNMIRKSVALKTD